MRADAHPIRPSLSYDRIEIKLQMFLNWFKVVCLSYSPFLFYFAVP